MEVDMLMDKGDIWQCSYFIEAISSYYNYGKNNPIIFSDPEGLYTIDPSCQGAKRRKVEDAANDACNRGKECVNSNLRGDLEKGCQNARIRCSRLKLGDIYYDGYIYRPEVYFACAATKSGTVTIYGYGFNPGLCGCLEAVLLHELLHAGGVPHPFPYACEKKCYPNCSKSDYDPCGC
jgi:hypothetical protein